MLKIKSWLGAKEKQASELAVGSTMAPKQTPLSSSRNQLLVFIIVFAIIGGYFIIQSFASTPYKQVDFSANPNWDGVNNRPSSAYACTTRNFNFGWDARKIDPSVAKGGVIGGTFDRSNAYRAFYAKVLPANKTLNDHLIASGSINVPNKSAGTMMLGWFNKTTSYDWRTPDFLGIRIDGNGTGDGDNTFNYIGEIGTKNNFAGGATLNGQSINKTFAWSFEYVPSGGTDGKGIIHLKIGNQTKDFSLTADQRADGATFDHFGLLNTQLDIDHPITAFFDSITLDGQLNSFNTNPGWEGSNNQLRDANDCLVHGRNDYGWSNQTQVPGAPQGQVGGIAWHSQKAGYYADKTQDLSLNNKLYATGKITLKSASPDSDVLFGWFDPNTVNLDDPGSPKNALAVHLGATSQWGYRLSPMYANGHGADHSFGSGGQYGSFKDAPMATPRNVSQNWWICYEPSVGSAGNGLVTVGVVGGAKVSIPVNKADITAGSKFDHFGLMDYGANGGGHEVIYYLDDLRYTIGPGDAGPADQCGTGGGSSSSGSSSSSTSSGGSSSSSSSGGSSSSSSGGGSSSSSSGGGQALLSHPDGTLIYNTSGTGIEIIKNGKRSPIISYAVLVSNGYSWDAVKYRVAGDDQLAAGPALPFREGTLLEAQGHVYVTDDSSGAQQKRGVVNWDAFVALGYSFNDIYHVTPDVLPSANGPDLTTTTSHPDGSLVYTANHSGVVLIEGGKRRNIIYGEIFASYGFRWDQVKNPTSGDNGLTQGSDFNAFREGTLVHNNGIVYVIDITSNGTQQKRAIANWNTFVTLGFKLSDTLDIPAYELPSQNGPLVGP